MRWCLPIQEKPIFKGEGSQVLKYDKRPLHTQQCLVCHRQCPGWVAQKTRCLFPVLLRGKTFHFPRETNGSKVQKKMPPVCVCVQADLREMMCNGEKMGELYDDG